MLHRAGKDGLGAGVRRRVRLGGSSAATTPWSRWTRTARTRPRSCRSCWMRWRTADVVLGSRWVRGGTVVNWPRPPSSCSRGGEPLHPARAGHADQGRHRRLSGVPAAACWRRSTSTRSRRRVTASRSILRGGRTADGFRRRRGADPVRGPRTRDVSKMSSSVVREALWRVTVWGTRSRLRALSNAVGGTRR